MCLQTFFIGSRHIVRRSETSLIDDDDDREDRISRLIASCHSQKKVNMILDVIERRATFRFRPVYTLSTRDDASHPLDDTFISMTDRQRANES